MQDHGIFLLIVALLNCQAVERNAQLYIPQFLPASLYIVAVPMIYQGHARVRISDDTPLCFGQYSWNAFLAKELRMVCFGKHILHLVF